MTYRITTSALAGLGVSPEQYAELIAEHARALQSWTAHMEAVARGEAQAYPGPEAPALIDQAVRRPDLIADFEVVDDLPTAEELLAARKRALLDAIARAETVAVESILPIAKHRLANMRYGAAVGKKPEERDAADLALIAEAEGRRGRFQAIELHAATMMSEVADLTADDVDGWTLTPFPGT